MRKITRILGISALVVTLSCASKIAYSFAQYAKVESRISEIKQGQSRAFVISRIGMPNYHAGACGEIGPAWHGCATEYVYSHPLAPLIPEYHVVTFSADDKVIASEEWDSP
jgi:hypothetical protein